MWRSYTLLGFALIAAIGAFSAYVLRHSGMIPSARESQQENVIGQVMPAFRLNNLAGETIASNTWQGKVALINFWASWCPPCRREIPAFAEVHEFYRDQGFEVIGIAVDQREPVIDFLSGMPQVRYLQLIGFDEAIAIGHQLGNQSGGLPYSIVVDRKGVIRYVKKGELSKSALLNVIEPLLGKTG